MIRDLIRFKKEVDNAIELMLNDNIENMEHFDLDMKLRCTTKAVDATTSVSVPFHADMYYNFSKFLVSQIVEELEYQTSHASLVWLSDLQEMAYASSGRVQPWFYTFKHINQVIIAPYSVEPVVYVVDYYPNFITSQWVTEAPEFLEHIRVNATMFLQESDHNGCYVDSQQMIEYGSIMSFKDAVTHFVEAVLNTGVDFDEIVNVTKANGTYWKACELLVELSMSEHTNENYKAIWKDGIHCEIK